MHNGQSTMVCLLLASPSCYKQKFVSNCDRGRPLWETTLTVRNLASRRVLAELELRSSVILRGARTVKVEEPS